MSVSYIKSIPTHEKIFAVGRSGPNATFNFFVLGLGWPWVGKFVGFILIFTCFPTQYNMVNRKHPGIQWLRVTRESGGPEILPRRECLRFFLLRATSIATETVKALFFLVRHGVTRASDRKRVLVVKMGMHPLSPYGSLGQEVTCRVSAHRRKHPSNFARQVALQSHYGERLMPLPLQAAPYSLDFLWAGSGWVHG